MKMITPEVLSTIVRSVWSSLMPQALDFASVDADSDGPLDLIGWVEVGGSWDAVIVLRAPTGLGHAVAAAMFDVVEVSDADMHDAWGELANMIGGWVKSSISGHCLLSLPTVTHAAAPTPPSGREAAASHFRVGIERFSAHVLESGGRLRRAPSRLPRRRAVRVA